MFTKILIPLDGSKLAERALKPAMALAEQGNGELYLLSVLFMEHIFVEERMSAGFWQPHLSVAQSRQDMQAYQQSIREQYAHPNVPIHTAVLEGDEAGVIVDTAVREDVDLIVMSTHGRSGLSRWMLGSVTERVLRQAPCPVLVIREDRPLQHIMIALDGSQLSECALTPGLEIASKLGSKLTLLSVETAEKVDPLFVAQLETIEDGLGARTVEDFYHRTENYLQRLKMQLQSKYGRAINLVTKIGSVVQAILDYIETDKVDLVVMATHGRTGLPRWVYGSVTEKVMRSAGCAMLIVRPPAAEFAQ